MKVIGLTFSTGGNRCSNGNGCSAGNKRAVSDVTYGSNSGSECDSSGSSCCNPTKWNRRNVDHYFPNVLNLLDNTVAVMLEERPLLSIRVDTAGKIVDSLPDVPVKLKELSLLTTVVASLTKAV